MDNKHDFREKAINVRKNISLKKEKSSIIFNKIKKLKYLKNIAGISCYINYENEVSTLEIIEYCLNSNINVFVPVIDFHSKTHDLILEQIVCLSPLKTHIVPCTNYNSLIELCIIPGVAFDNTKNRLGFGKGYYDSFLNKLDKKIIKVGICFNEQLYPEIPIEDHDIKMDIVVTDKKII